jgi:RNA polymerase sigma factor (sigma-70 family)
MDAEEFYRQHLTAIGQIALSVCRRGGVDDHDAEDFASDIRLKLCDDNYAVIRKFQGKSSFTTYLTVVINKSFLDHRRKIWGKWTPSSQAKRLGARAFCSSSSSTETDAHSTRRAGLSSKSMESLTSNSCEESWPNCRDARRVGSRAPTGSTPYLHPKVRTRS